MRLAVLTITLVLCGIGQATGGEISKRAYSRYFEWESSSCSKPSAPYIYELDQYNRWQAERYVDDIEQYISCVESEAEADFSEGRKKLADAIEAGRDEAISDAQGELEDFIDGLN